MDNIEWDYPMHILYIKLWEWEAVKENANMQIQRHGPEQTICEVLETSMTRIGELKKAIAKLKEH